jgi:hypothetical protein
MCSKWSHVHKKTSQINDTFLDTVRVGVNYQSRYRIQDKHSACVVCAVINNHTIMHARKSYMHLWRCHQQPCHTSRILNPKSPNSPESRVQSPESRVQSPEFPEFPEFPRVPSPESRVQSPESRVQSPESRVHSSTVLKLAP